MCSNAYVKFCEIVLMCIQDFDYMHNKCISCIKVYSQIPCISTYIYMFLIFLALASNFLIFD